MQRWIVGLLALALLVSGVALAACGGDDSSTTSTPTQEASPTPTSTGAPASDAETEILTESSGPSSRVTAQQAAEVALETAPGGTVVEISPGLERGRATWEVLVRNSDGSGTEVYILAATGEVLKQEPATVPAEAKGSGPAVSAQEASDVALGAVPEGTIVEIDLGTERGTTVWEVLVRGSSGREELYIDAATGDIIKRESAD